MAGAHIEPLSVDEVLALPVVVDVPTAGRAFGLGRDLAYQLAAAGELGVPVLRLGSRLKVRRADILTALRIPDRHSGGAAA